MLKAIKSNREYTIAEEERERYIEQGFDIAEVDVDGKIKSISRAASRVVSRAEHEALKAEHEALKETKVDGKKEFSHDELKAVGMRLGLDFPGNIGRDNLIALIKAEPPAKGGDAE
jgi:hypothetical protein